MCRPVGPVAGRALADAPEVILAADAEKAQLNRAKREIEEPPALSVCP